MTAALKLETVVHNTQTILGIEAMCAAQAIDLLAPLAPGEGTSRAHQIVRREVPHLERDRYLAPDIAALTGVVARGELAALMGELYAGRDGAGDEA